MKTKEKEATLSHEFLIAKILKIEMMLTNIISILHTKLFGVSDSDDDQRSNEVEEKDIV